MNFWVKTSFWTKILVTFNFVMTTVQAVLTANNSEHIWNYIFLGGQLIGNIIGLWTEDKNKDGIIDIVQDDPIVVTSTTTTTIKKDEPITSETETTIKKE